MPSVTTALLCSNSAEEGAVTAVGSNNSVYASKLRDSAAVRMLVSRPVLLFVNVTLLSVHMMGQVLSCTVVVRQLVGLRIAL
jgi:hypothetical protein